MRHIVIIKEDFVPRNEWRLGKVPSVCEDEDGKATIQTGNKNLGQRGQRLSNPSIIERPIQKLVVLVESSSNVP